MRAPCFLIFFNSGKAARSIAPKDRNRFRAFNERICRGEKGSLEFDIVGLADSFIAWPVDELPVASLVSLNQRPLSSAFVHQALLLRPMQLGLTRS